MKTLRENIVSIFRNISKDTYYIADQMDTSDVFRIRNLTEAVIKNVDVYYYSHQNMIIDDNNVGSLLSQLSRDFNKVLEDLSTCQDLRPWTSAIAFIGDESESCADMIAGDGLSFDELKSQFESLYDSSLEKVT